MDRATISKYDLQRAPQYRTQMPTDAHSMYVYTGDVKSAPLPRKVNFGVVEGSPFGVE